jgi:hypothetical protein
VVMPGQALKACANWVPGGGTVFVIAKM